MLQAPFLEDAVVPRPVAAMRAELLPCDGGAVLRLSVNASGVVVEPLPGLQGVHGHNERTAEELQRLLREHALQLVLRRSGENLPGQLLEVARGTLPMRRLRDDGDIDFSARTAELTLGATFASPVITDSPAYVYLLADDAPRVVACVDRIGGEWRITELASLAAPAPVIGAAK